MSTLSTKLKYLARGNSPLFDQQRQTNPSPSYNNQINERALIGQSAMALQ